MEFHKELKNLAEYIPFRFLIGFLRLMPYEISRRLIIFTFQYIAYGIGIRRKVAERQLNDVFPELDLSRRKEILKKVYRNLALNVVTSFITPDEKLFRMTSFENLENLDEALILNKGVLLVTGHIGDWEAPCRVLPMKGYGLAILVKKQRNTLFDIFNNAIRERQGGRIIYMRNALRGVLAHLNQNHMIGILIDQDAGRRGVLADFLGKPASCWKGAAKIALRYKIPIVPAYALRNPDESLKFTFDKMILNDDWQENE